MSVLVRHFSLRSIDLAEEVVQASLLQALQSWRTRGIPDQPAAWLRRVARNRMLDRLRHERVIENHRRSHGEPEPTEYADDAFLDSEIADSQLRMMFVCCDSRLTDEDRVALTLKTLCGFNHVEIARALLSQPEAIKKRLQRAKASLAEWGLTFDWPAGDEFDRRLFAVHRVIYLLFNEGYLSTSDDQVIRRDLCDEAIRLTTILADHERYAHPASDALLSLMLFHFARFEARLDETGQMILLADQDRKLWDSNCIRLAKARLDRSARGNVISRFHLEAGIAMQHCIAPSFAKTNWPMIIRLYDSLIAAIPSPVYQLNRAIAVAELYGPEAGLQAIADAKLEETLANYHLLHATLGDLYRRLERWPEADAAFAKAIAGSQSPREKELLDRKRRSLNPMDGA